MDDDDDDDDDCNYSHDVDDAGDGYVDDGDVRHLPIIMLLIFITILVSAAASWSSSAVFSAAMITALKISARPQVGPQQHVGFWVPSLGFPFCLTARNLWRCGRVFFCLRA